MDQPRRARPDLLLLALLPFLLAAGPLGLPADRRPPPAAPAGRLSLGVNIPAVNDWDPAQPFADAMKSARRFGSIGQPSDEKAPVDADGWPTGDAGVVVLIGVPHMAGTYALSFTGDARVGVNAARDPHTRVTRTRHDARRNTTTAQVEVGPAEQNLFLTFAGQAGGVKDVKLMRPGHAPGELFSRPFLARLARFRALRFMDFTETNGNAQVEWADRSRPGYATQQRRPGGVGVGAAWEYVVLLANQARKDVWINVPHQATDAYVTRLARLLRYGSDGVEPYASPQAHPAYPPLDPGLAIYVEWSNELWNGGFAQSGWLGAQADAAIAARDPDLLYDGSAARYPVMFRLVGRRTAEISALFRAVFGDAAMLTRVRPILPAQLANPGTLAEPLAWLEARRGGAASSIWAAAGAAYVTILDDDAGHRTGLTLDAVFSEMARYADANLGPWTRTFARQAREAGLRMVAYEGGQHLTGDGSVEVKLAAQSDPRMREVLLRNYADWSAAGGDLFVHYSLCSTWNRYGAWGLSSDITSEAGPKWDAVARTAAALP